jgi:hypothetical protein
MLGKFQKESCWSELCHCLAWLRPLGRFRHQLPRVTRVRAYQASGIGFAYKGLVTWDPEPNHFPVRNISDLSTHLTTKTLCKDELSTTLR